MPMYDYQCKGCGATAEKYRRISERKLPVECGCGLGMSQAILSAPFAIIQDDAHYICPVTGEQTTSWKQRRNTFAKHDLIDANEVGIDTNYKKWVKKADDRQKVIDANPIPPEVMDAIQKTNGVEQKFHTL